MRIRHWTTVSEEDLLSIFSRSGAEVLMVLARFVGFCSFRFEQERVRAGAALLLLLPSISSFYLGIDGSNRQIFFFCQFSFIYIFIIIIILYIYEREREILFLYGCESEGWGSTLKTKDHVLGANVYSFALFVYGISASGPPFISSSLLMPWARNGWMANPHDNSKIFNSKC